MLIIHLVQLIFVFLEHVPSTELVKYLWEQGSNDIFHCIVLICMSFQQNQSTIIHHRQQFIAVVSILFTYEYCNRIFSIHAILELLKHPLERILMLIPYQGQCKYHILQLVVEPHKHSKWYAIVIGHVCSVKGNDIPVIYKQQDHITQ
jgi:hypothetical protein